jgi:hypothetical protein
VESHKTVERAQADLAALKIRSRIRGLWIALAVWVIILVNAIRIAPDVSHWIPSPIVVLGILFNVGLVAVTAILLKRAYDQLRAGGGSGDAE